MGKLDFRLIAVLFGLAIVTHLVNLSYPHQVVFDEVHFGKFITAYCCTGHNFFDIHPPHAKLLTAGSVWLQGYRGGFDFDHIGEQYGIQSAFALRSFSALTGILFVPLIYILLRQFGVDRSIAFLGGWLVLFDNALTVQTRVIALDGLLLLATFGSLSAWLAGWQAFKKGKSGWWLWWFVLAGALAGLAAGTKFTGLAAVGLLGSLVGWRIITVWRWPKEVKKWIGVGVVILLTAFIVFEAGWVVHFALLTKEGRGDLFYKANFSGLVWPLAQVRESFHLQRVMLDVNYNLTATHPYESRWWTWPLMLRPIFYWQGGGGLIYFLGNPLVWWGSTTLFVTAFWLFLMNQVSRRKKSQAIGLWTLLVGYFIAMLPLMRVPRALFLYHYLTPLFFSLLFGLVWLDDWLKRLNGGIRNKQNAIILYSIVLGSTLFLFMFFSPLTYGIPVSARSKHLLFWLSSWQ